MKSALLCVALFACTHQEVVAGETAAKTCGMAQGSAQLANVAKDLAGSDFEAQLTSDASLIGIAEAALTCLVATAVAVIEARDAEAVSGSGVKMTMGPSPIVSHGRAYLAKHVAIAP